MLEFGVPRGLWRPLWELYVRVGPPARRPPDLAGLARGRPLPRPEHPGLLRATARARLLELWREAGIEDVRARRVSLGGGIVVWGRRAMSRYATRGRRSTRSRPAAGATTSRCCTRPTRSGISATLRSAARSHPARLARARDNGARVPPRHGRRRARARRAARTPTRDSHSRLALRSLAARPSQCGSASARQSRSSARCGSFHSSRWVRSSRSPTTWSSSAAGSTATCGSGWRGARFPLLTGAFAVAGRIRLDAILAATFAVLLSLAQRVLSTQSDRPAPHRCRRRFAHLRDGRIEPVGPDLLVAAAERALKLLGAATVALATALVVRRLM